MIQAFVVGQRVRVPEDVAVAGYDDIEFARSTIVPLTTVRTPHAELGAAAADLLFDEMALLGSDDPAERAVRPHIEFSPELVVRTSTSIR